MARSSWLLLIGVAAALACRSDPTEPKPASAEAQPEGPHAFDPDAHAGDPKPASTLALLDAGAEPREQLRYAEQAPSRKLVLSNAQIHSRAKGKGGPEGPMLVLLVAWTGVEAEGETRRYLYEMIEVEGGWMIDGMPGTSQREGMEKRVVESLIAGYEGLAGQATGTASGLDHCVQTRGMPMRPDPGAQLEMFAVPLPSHAIGVGATWTRTAVRDELVGSLRPKPTSPEQEGPKRPRLLPERSHDPHFDTHAFTDVERYTLVAREGDVLTIGYAMTSQSDDPVNAPGTSSSGRFEVSLSDALPRSGTLEVTTSMAFPQADGQPPEYMQIGQQIVLETRD